METTIETITDDFAFLDDWEDRYRYVIELGKSLPAFPDDARTAANKVNGCVSQVWLVSETGSGEDPEIIFQGDSDAHIVRGLVAIMIAALSKKRASEIIASDVEGLLQDLGLDEHLSPQRANGLRAMIERMRNEARAVTKAA